MDTQLVRFTQWAERHPQARYNALMGLLSQPEGLLHSFEAQPGNKARGIDAVGKADYAEGVETRIAALSTKLRSLSYRPQPKSTGQVLQSNILERSGPPLVRNSPEANVSFGRGSTVGFFLLSQRLAEFLRKVHNQRTAV